LSIVHIDSQIISFGIIGTRLTTTSLGELKPLIIESIPIRISSAAPIIVVDNLGRVEYASKAAFDLLGQSHVNDDFVSLQQIITNNILALIIDYFDQCVKEKKSINFHYQKIIRINDQLSQPVELTFILIKYNNAECLAILLRDISRDIEKQNKIDLSDARFRTLVENISDIAVTWMSTPGVQEMLYVNKGYENIWGRTCDSLYASPQSFIELIHPEDKHAVRQHLQEHSEGSWNIDYRIIRDDGEIRYIHDTGKGVYNKNGELEYLVGTAVDVTVQVSRRLEIERYVKKLENYSQHDELTRVFNRRTMLVILSQHLADYKRHGHVSALVFIDVKNLKYINDNYGHSAGDQILFELSQHLRTKLRNTDTVGRYAGDEFIIILNESSMDDSIKVMNNLCGTSLDLEYKDMNLVISYDFGIALVNEKGIKSVDDWIKIADQRMYDMKKENKSRI